MKKQTMSDQPGIWAAMLAWLIGQRNEIGYAVVAFVMFILASLRKGNQSRVQRLAGAAMCSLFAVFIKPAIAIIGLLIPVMSSLPENAYWVLAIGIGYYGVDSIFEAARKKFLPGTGGDNADGN